MSINIFFSDLYKDIFSLNSLYEIIRNILTVVAIGIALYIFIEIYPITSEYLLFLLALVGVLSYFCLPIVSKIPMLIAAIILKDKGNRDKIIVESYVSSKNEIRVDKIPMPDENEGPWYKRPVIMVPIALAVIGIVVGIVGINSDILFPPKPTIELTYSEITNDTFKGHIEARNLKKNTDYYLCIKGKSGRSGNTYLMEFSQRGEEGYLDFDQVRSDSFRSLSTDFEVKDHLPEGKYDAKFLIKDLSNNYKSIASYNFLKFEISRDNVSESYKTVNMKILN